MAWPFAGRTRGGTSDSTGTDSQSLLANHSFDITPIDKVRQEVSPEKGNRIEKSIGLGRVQECFSDLLFRTCLVGFLLGSVASIYFLLGRVGYVGSQWLNWFAASGLAVAALFFVYAFVGVLWQKSWVGRFCSLSLVILLGAEIILGLLPPTARDELTHHLAIPRLYARAGRIVEIPFAPYSYYPMLLDMLYTPWVVWGYDFVPKLVHGLFGFFTGLCLCAYLSRRMNGVYGLLGFFFFVSIPAVLRLSHWAYVDLGVTFYSTASLLCILRWREEKNATWWLIMAALSAGFAVAVKPNGLVALLLLSFLFLFTLANETGRGASRIASEILIFGVLALLPILPWLGKNYWQTGNPFFPHFGHLFPGKVVEGMASSASYAGLGIFAKREFLYGESGWQIAALPLRVFFSGQDDNPQYFDGALSPALILLLPWAFKGKWIEEKKVFFSFALLFFAYAIFLADLRIRYILPIVPPLVVLFVYGIFNVYLRIKRPAYLMTALLIFAGLHGAYLWSYVRDAAAVGYLVGRESREAYLTRMLAEYPVFQYISRETAASAKIYLLFVGRRAYYCERDYFHDGGDLPGLLLNAIQSARDPAQIEKTLKNKGITHLMIREDLLERFLSQNLSVDQRKVWDSFVARGLWPRFRDRGYALYQIYG